MQDLSFIIFFEEIARQGRARACSGDLRDGLRDALRDAERGSPRHAYVSAGLRDMRDAAYVRVGTRVRGMSGVSLSRTRARDNPATPQKRSSDGL
jgi:hypothetical protein